MKEHRLISALALVLFVTCLVGIARADTVSITWTNPTKNTDASVIPDTGAGSLQSWRFEYGTCSAPNVFGTKVGEFPRTRAVGGPALTTTTNNFDPGQTCIRGYVTNTYGVESDVSNITMKTVTPPKPGPILMASGDQAFAVIFDRKARHYNVGNQFGTATIGAEGMPEPVLGDGYCALAHPLTDSQPWKGYKRTKIVAAQCDSA